MKRVAIQGVKGCFHEIAAREFFHGEEIDAVECETFEELFDTVKREGIIATLAIENTIAGSLLQNHILLKESGLKIAGEQKIRIRHNLVAMPGQELESIKEVYSHPIALMQIRNFLDDHKFLKAVEWDDTASSAKMIAREQCMGKAGVCSEWAAEIYGLEILNITPVDRVLDIQEYYFSKKLREVAELNAQGKDIISLGIGSPDRMPSEEALNTLNEVAHQPNAHGYQSYQGIPELRKAFSDFYKRWYGVDLDPNKEILPLIGSKEGVFFLSLTFINPGDGVLVPNPGYPTYTSASKIIGARMINYDLSEENGWQPDFEKLEKMDLTGEKMMWCNYPNMPTGGN